MQTIQLTSTSIFISLILLFITPACSSSNADPSISSAHPTIVISLKGEPEYREINVEVTQQNNCGGNAEVEYQIQKSRSIVHNIEVGTEFDVNTNGQIGFAGTDIELGVTVANELGYSYGAGETLARSITVKAKEKTFVEHHIKLQEVWKVGTATVIIADNETKIPFYFRTDFAIDLIESKELKEKCGVNAAISYYDDFNNSAFDGKYDSDLWSYDGTKHVEMKQQNGVFALITKPGGEDGSNALVADSKSWILQDLGLVEAKLKLDSSRRGQGSFVKIQAVAWEDELPYFIECQLGNSEIDHTSYFCNYQAREWSTTEEWAYEYETEIIEGKYDTWYVARFEVDSKTLEIQFFLDDKLIGSYTPKDANILRKARFYPLIGSWAGPDDNFIGYIDDVRIGK